MVAGYRGFFLPDTDFSLRPYDDETERVWLRVNADVEAHNEAIVANWNSVVGPNDIVWHLGDVGFGSWELLDAYLSRLNGEINLVTGNHDKVWPGERAAYKFQKQWMQRFNSIQQYARMRIDGETVFLSHFPYSGDHTSDERFSQYRLRDEGQWILHGHTHSTAVLSGTYTDRQIHVGVDAWNLTPVPVEEIARTIKVVKAVETRPILAPIAS